MKTTGLVTTCLTVLILASGSMAAELKSETSEAFDRYVAATESRMRTEIAGDTPFLWLERLDGRSRADVLRRLEAGEVVIERLETRDGGEELHIPNGMVHHWVGTVLLPDVTLADAAGMARDYDRYPEIYAPEITASHVRERTEDRYRVYLRLFTRKIVTWVANTEHVVEFLVVDDGRMHVPSRSTHIVEVEHPDTPQEREKPVGHDRGFAWRLNNYCSFEQRRGHTIMQCETITLTRSIPLVLSMIVRPFVTSVPREKLTFTLEAARRHLTVGAAGR